MTRGLLLTILLFALISICKAQKKRPFSFFGDVSNADLTMTTCEFEKGAGAMVLFDKEDVFVCSDSLTVLRHKRIKIFNENGKDQANIRLPFYAADDAEKITVTGAETIRLENGETVITKVDPMLIYTEKIDKYRKALVFAFPDVKPGCVVEYTYKYKTANPANFPSWYFQARIPVRYSEVSANIADAVKYKIIGKGYQQFSDTSVTAMQNNRKEPAHLYHWDKVNVRSLVNEPFITAGNKNVEALVFQPISFTDIWGGRHEAWDSNWVKIIQLLLIHPDFGAQLDKSLEKENAIIKQAKALKTVDEKIAYLFNEVKTSMKWNGTDVCYTEAGVQKAWSKKTGNATEINLILYNLLKKSGIDALPVIAGSRDNDEGSINPYYSSLYQITKAVVYVAGADSTHYYVLDATGKYNVYNEIPGDLLNTYAVKIFTDRQSSINGKLVFLKNEVPAKHLVFVTGEITADGNVKGSVTMNTSSYGRAMYKQEYDKRGEGKYIDYLRDDDNQLKLSNLSFENMETDSLPLIQKFDFSVTSSLAADNYIYFDTNRFTPFHINYFLNEERFSDLDFGNCTAYSINGVYKLPPGYKVDTAPQNTLLNMYDKSIVFRRIISEDNGQITVNYTITHKRSIYSVTEYKSIRDFYKKVFELVNEPVVLKKV